MRSTERKVGGIVGRRGNEVRGLGLGREEKDSKRLKRMNLIELKRERGGCIEEVKDECKGRMLKEGGKRCRG